MTDRDFTTLVEKYLEGECTRREKAQLRAILESDESRKACFLNHYRLHCAMRVAAAQKSAQRHSRSRARWHGLTLATAMAAVAVFMVAIYSDTSSSQAVPSQLAYSYSQPVSANTNFTTPAYSFDSMVTVNAPATATPASFNTSTQASGGQFGTLLGSELNTAMPVFPNISTSSAKSQAPLPPQGHPSELFRLP